MNITVRVMAQQALAQMAALRSGTGGVTSSLGGASSAARGFGLSLASANLVKWGSQMQWVGRQIEYNFTAPLVAAGGFAIKWAMQNEEAFTRLKKVYGDADLQKALGTAGINNELQALQRNLVALSNYFGIAQADAINIAADWAAAGTSGVALAKAVQLTMKTMSLGELDAATATKALIAIQSQFAFSTDDLAKTINQLNMVENQTGISMGGLIEGFSRAAGVARNAGIDTLHLAAMLAAMSPAAGSAAQAGNALKTIISRLLSPTKEAVQVLGLMGVQTTDVAWKSSNASQRLEILAKNFTKLSDGQKAVVSSVIASRYQINKFDVLMEAIINKQSFYHKALESAADADKNAAQATRELNAVLDSNPKKMDQIVNIMKNSAAEIGQQLIPSFLMLANMLRLALQWFNNLPPSMQKFILMAAVIVALLGPAIRYMSVLVTTVGILGQAFAWLAGTATAATVGLVRFAAGGALFSWIPVLGAGIIDLGKAMLVFGLYSLQGIRTFVAGSALIQAGWAAITRAWMIGIAFLQRAIILGATGIGAAWRALYVRMVAITVTSGAALGRAWVAVMASISKFTGIAGTAINTAWRFTLFAMASSTSILTKIQFIFMTWWRALVVITTAAGAAMVEAGRAIWVAMGVIWANGMAAISAIQAAGSTVWGGITAAGAVAMAGLQRIVLAGAAGLGVIWRAAQAGLVAIQAAGSRAMMVISSLTFTNLRAIFVRGWGVLVTITSAAMDAIIAALTGPWGIAIAAVIIILVAFWGQIKKIFGAIVNYVISAFNALPQGVRNALMAVVNMVHDAAMAIYQLFSYINPFAHHSPSLVENVTNGLAEVGQQFDAMESKVASSTKAAYGMIQTFGNAVAGLIAKANALDLANIKTDFTKAGFAGAFPAYEQMNAELQSLQGELKSAQAAVDAQQAVVDQWKDKLDAANDALDAQQKILDGLQNTLDKTNDQLSAAKDALQNFMDTPITGETALNDAIKANNLEQKKLQLQMMQMEDATGPLDDISKKYDDINGMIELLRGQQNELRHAGAGSEITGVFDAQLAGLKAQQKALETNSSPLQEMSKQLDALKRKADELDLEKAINFDALHDQIEQAGKAMQEMPFDQILAGVTSTRAQVESLTTTYNQQKAAVEAQKTVVDQYKAARDAVQASYDAENKQLQQVQKNYDAVQKSVSEVKNAMDEAAQAASKLAQAADAAKKKGSDSLSPGAQNFKDAAGANFPNVGGTGGIGREGGLGDQSKMIDDLTKGLNDELNKQLASLNPFNWIKNAWNATVNWWKTTVWPWLTNLFKGISFGGGGDGGDSPFKGFVDKAKDFWDTLKMIWGWLSGTFKNLGTLLGPTLKSLGDMFKNMGPPLQELWTALKNLWSSLSVIWPILKIIAEVIGVVLIVAIGALVVAFKLVADTLIGILGPVINGIIKIIAGVTNVISGLINFITGVFTGNWSQAWEGIKQIFLGIWQTVQGLFTGIIGGIWGGIKGFFESIVNIAKWLYDTLVGHSIIPDLVNGIISWMLSLPGKILTGIANFGQQLLNWATAAWSGMVNKATQLATGLLDWVKQFPNKTVQNLATLGQLLLNAGNQHFQQFISAVQAKGTAALNYVKTLPTTISNALGNLGTYLKSKGESLIQGLIDGIMNKVTAVKNSMTSIANTIKSYLPGSPVKAGPMKGRGELRYAGQKLMTNISNGIEDGRNFLGKTMNSVGGDVSAAFDAIGSDSVRSAGKFVATSADALRTAAVSQANDMLANQARLATLAMNAEAGVINTGNSTVINLNGDLVLPNVSSGADAESFVRNLEALATGGRG